MPAKAGIQVDSQFRYANAWIPPVEDRVILPRGGNDEGKEVDFQSTCSEPLGLGSRVVELLVTN